MIGEVILFAELSTWFGLWRKTVNDKRKRILTYASRRPREIPILDGKIRRLAGRSPWHYRQAARLAVLTIRKFSQTKAFEYLVLAKINPESRLNRSQRKTPVKICV